MPVVVTLTMPDALRYTHAAVVLSGMMKAQR